jgi:hypothetical protein
MLGVRKWEVRSQEIWTTADLALACMEGKKPNKLSRGTDKPLYALQDATFAHGDARPLPLA